MESRKICRLLIAIFIVLILMFCFLFKIEESKQTVLSEEFIFEAVENISSNGISISEEMILRDVPETNIYCLDEKAEEDFFEIISSSLITTVFGGNVSTTQFDTPSGTTLGIYTNEGDESELGRLVFSENDYTFSISRKGVSMSGGEDPITNMDTSSVSETAMGKISEIVEKLNSKSRMDYRITGSTFDNDFLIVTVNQTVAGYDIDTAHINFVFENDDIIIVSGKWITSLAKSEYHNTLTDGVNVLYKLDFDNVSAIHGERIVYSLRKADNNRTFLLPCWEISYNDNNGNFKKSYFDAV